MTEKVYEIAVLKGDGIGPEVVDEALKVLEVVQQSGGPACRFEIYPCGATCYLEQGDPLPAATVEACRQADAVLLGAMGLPHVRWPDGTEMRPQVDLRFKLDLYAGVRPIYLYNPDHTPLKRMDVGDIDLVILRENVEGLFASMNAGIELRGQVEVDSMVINKSPVFTSCPFLMSMLFMVPLTSDGISIDALSDSTTRRMSSVLTC